jgi:O-antigen/teichoic acid export membrane protein
MLILAFVLLLIFGWITFDQYIPLYVLAVSVPAGVLLFSLLRNKDFSFRSYSMEMARIHWKEMANIGMYGILIGFSGMVILNIDRIMVERMLGLSLTGIYTTMAFFATLVSIPSRALLKISDPIIAQSWKDNDMQGLKDNYYRSSLNQTIIGALMLIGLWGNIGNILRILPSGFEAGSYVVLFISLAFFTDMATGTSIYILANSKYFKYQTYLIVILVFFIVISNLIFIPIMGITGAALATFISKFLNNLMLHQFVFWKFKLQPYNWKYLVIIGASLMAYLAGYFLPEIQNLYIDIVLRSCLIGGIFAGLILLTGISKDINEKFLWLIGKRYK